MQAINFFSVFGERKDRNFLKQGHKFSSFEFTKGKFHFRHRYFLLHLPLSQMPQAVIHHLRKILVGRVCTFISGFLESSGSIASEQGGTPNEQGHLVGQRAHFVSTECKSYNESINL